MARYYFHLVDGTDILLDPEGIEIADGAIAQKALRHARSMIASDVLNGEINLCYAIEVKDEPGNLVHRLPFGEAVRVREPASA
jgi:hypothetical protein